MPKGYLKDGTKIIPPNNRGRKYSEAYKDKYYRGENNPFFGKKHSEEIKKKLSIIKIGRYVGEKHPNWKGGLPDCLDCGKQLSKYDAKRCNPCNGGIHEGESNQFFGKKHTEKSRESMSKSHIGIQAGNKHPRWKNGISKTREYKRFYGRRADYRRKNASGSHTLEEWLLLKAFYQYMCLCCKKQEPEIKLTEDHIVPLSRGGSNDIANIQPLCHSCNSRKSVKIINYSLGESLYGK